MLDVSIDIERRTGLGFLVIGLISLNIIYNVSKAAIDLTIEIRNGSKAILDSRKQEKLSQSIINDRRYII